MFGYLEKEIGVTVLKKPILREIDGSIFFIGHSAGSYFLNDVAKKYGDGFIQLGSVLNSNGKLPWEIEKLN